MCACACLLHMYTYTGICAHARVLETRKERFSGLCECLDTRLSPCVCLFFFFFLFSFFLQRLLNCSWDINSDEQ